MNYYLLLLVLIIFTYIIIEKILNIKNKEVIFLKVAFIEMLLFLGLRDVSVGIDLKNYIPYFNMIKQAKWNNLFILKLEKGYILLNKLISIFGNENLFLFVIAIITLSGVYFSIKHFSKNYFFSIFIFITFQFYIFQFSGLRQSIAYSIILISLKYIKERNWIKFIVTVLIASTFHKTAIIFIPAYWIAKNKINIKSIKLFFVILILLYILKIPILTLITKYIYKTYDVLSSTDGYNMLILLLSIFVFFLLIKNRDNENNDIWFNMLMVAVLIQSLASVQGNIARLTMYYSYSLMFLIPNAIHDIESTEQRITIKTVIYILLFVFYLTNIQMPYKTFF